MARLEFWCICWLVLCVSVVRFVSGDVFVIKKCDGFKTMTLSFHGSPTVYLQKTRGGQVKVTKDLPGIVVHVKFGRTTLKVPYSSHYGYMSQQHSQYVLVIAFGRPSNWRTFTCPKIEREPVLLDAVSSVTERCTMANHEKLPCGGSSSITQADCEANNCCYDLSSSTSPCYYADDVTVQCTLDGQFVVVVSENVTLPPLDLGSIQLVDSSSPSCSPVTSLSSFVVYQFPVSACGSTVQLAGGNVTYQNTMSAAITVSSGPEGSITRDSVYKLFFQCTYSGSQDVQVEAEVYTVAPPLPVVEQGPFDLELVIATDPTYGSYYVDADYPVTKTLRDPVAVEVHIVNRTDPNLVLTLGDCWVTPGPSASSQPQWSLLVNGCPYTGDNYLTSLLTVDSTSGVAYPSHYKRFVFEMFAFVDPVAQQALAEKIFIYCVAVACYPSATDPCTQSCPARRSGRAADKLARIASSRKNVLLHSGPVVLEADQVLTSRLQQQGSGRAADKLAQIHSSRKNVLLHSGPVIMEADQVQTSRLKHEAPFPTGYLVLGVAVAMLMMVLILAVVAVRRLNSQKVNLKF
ncbi:zona pellucida sperm-binding protein 4-like isoform X4 [Erpetoichthys calabaricus]|uniref:zona pellucida sperm-binding protein 4-like isoform X4 n=1 Tax=Erpetoichthys calabaricus TaxID=27687 RepID=UPI0022342758|nr:zona pellucida sperm-binding protein 4-like isoform X4 [Erpetoichthys calabaricus]